MFHPRKFEAVIGSEVMSMTGLKLGDKFKALSQLARMYVGAELDFDIQPVLKKEEVPPCRLGRAAGGRLGWNTWMKTKEMARDAEQAVFMPRE